MEQNRQAISLFSGAMGLDLGLMAAGIHIAIGQDFNPACIRTMQQNGHDGISCDIRTLTADDLLAATHMKIGEPFMICGGPPCQPFSTAGNRLGVNDPRGSLFKDYVRMIDAIRPRFFVMENVRGMTNLYLKTESGQSSSTTVLDVVLEEFEKLHYSTVYGVLNAVDYGVPQFRERLLILGSRDGECLYLPQPTHFRGHQDERYRWRTLRSAIADLEAEPGECASFGAVRTQYLQMIPEGGNWRNLPPEIAKVAMGGAYTSSGGKCGCFRRLSYNEPSPTLMTSPVQKTTMLCHPTQDRPLSVAEYARIQQFPDNWQICGSVTEKYRQLGNAVPVGLAKAVGQAVLSAADGSFEVACKRRAIV